MTKHHLKEYKIWNTVFQSGFVIVLCTTTLLAFNLAFSTLWVFSLIGAGACFIGAFLTFQSYTKKTKRIWILLSIASIEIFAAIFLKRTPRLITFTHYVVFIFILNINIIAFAVSYRNIFSAVFPKAIKIIEIPPPDPITFFPENTQAIIDKGRKWINGSVGVSIAFFFLVSAVGYLLMFRGENTNFFIITLGSGFLISFAIGILATYKWQKGAIQSGIPIEELEKAAKVAGLWWPKYKAKTIVENDSQRE